MTTYNSHRQTATRVLALTLQLGSSRQETPVNCKRHPVPLLSHEGCRTTCPHLKPRGKHSRARQHILHTIAASAKSHLAAQDSNRPRSPHVAPRTLPRRPGAAAAVCWHLGKQSLWQGRRIRIRSRSRSRSWRTHTSTKTQTHESQRYQLNRKRNRSCIGICLWTTRITISIQF